VRRALGGCVLLGLAVVACTAAAGATEPQRFALSATSAAQGDAVELRFRGAATRPSTTTRLYLVSVADAVSVRSRVDRRLHFVGTIASSPRARRVFTVPPLDPGIYALAYWCRGCLAHGVKVAVERSPRLRVRAADTDGCPVTAPNGDAPPGAPRTSWRYVGNGHLAVLLPPTPPSVTTNSLGGYKMFWIARPGVIGAFSVTYRRLDVPSTTIRATTVRGSLNGFDGPSWASRMSFEPGCWEIWARVDDVGLGFVADVVRGPG
jgi:hypothetical protein